MSSRREIDEAWANARYQTVQNHTTANATGTGERNPNVHPNVHFTDPYYGYAANASAHTHASSRSVHPAHHQAPVKATARPEPNRTGTTCTIIGAGSYVRFWNQNGGKEEGVVEKCAPNNCYLIGFSDFTLPNGVIKRWTYLGKNNELCISASVPRKPQNEWVLPQVPQLHQPDVEPQQPQRNSGYDLDAVTAGTGFGFGIDYDDTQPSVFNCQHQHQHQPATAWADTGSKRDGGFDAAAATVTATKKQKLLLTQDLNDEDNDNDSDIDDDTFMAMFNDNNYDGDGRTAGLSPFENTAASAYTVATATAATNERSVFETTARSVSETTAPSLAMPTPLAMRTQHVTPIAKELPAVTPVHVTPAVATAAKELPTPVRTLASSQRSTSTMPPRFAKNGLNPPGAHLHHHLPFLRCPKDAQDRTSDHIDYDPRTLTVVLTQYEAFNEYKRMSSEMVQWWDFKAQYFDTVIFFQKGKLATQGLKSWPADASSS
jgi:hypothetical protein